MGIRFRRSVKILPGVRLNLNKNSTSVTFGGKGAKYTVSSTGRKTASIGIPGTGVSYVTSTGGTTKGQARPRKTYSPRTYKVCGVIMIIIAALSLLIGLISIAAGGVVFLLLGAACLAWGISWLRKSKTT